jgi:hypothetical protein
MHKKQAKKTAKNQVGVYKNTPLATQTSYEEFEDFLKKYLDISSPGKLFDLLDHWELPYSCKCSVTEEMLIDSLIDLDPNEVETCEDKKDINPPKSFYESIKNLKLDESSSYHTDFYDKIHHLYKQQREINSRNSQNIKNYIKNPLEYFGKVKLLRDIDETLGNIFKKKKYKKPKKGSKIFDRSIKTVDNSAADEILIKLEEFKKVFPDIEYPIYEGNLCEESVEVDGIVKDGFMRY